MQLKQDAFRKLISCQSGGISAALLRLILTVAAIGYSIAVGLRNFLYSKGWLKAHQVNAIVISVGNITTGGTGKTPLVIWLCNKITQNSKLKTQNYKCAILTCGYKVTQNSKLKTQNYKCAILTRGYKVTQNSKLKTQNYEDEPAILAESCPETQVIVNPDRVAGAAEAIGKFGAKVLIMDDGFQHRRLARDLDIVTIDATQPFGYGKLLPAGLLREPVTALKRADAVVITRCDQIIKDKLAELEQTLQQINPNMIVARSIHAPNCVNYAEPFVIPAEAGIQKNVETVDSCLRRNDSLKQLKDKKIFAFCGIGNPDAFFKTIKGLGAELIDSKIYNDHHHYTESEIADIQKQAKRLEADLILTTQKDWFSTQYAIRNTQREIPFTYLAVELKFLAGGDKLKALIENTITDKIYAK